MNRIDRLFALLLMLQQRRRVRAQDLAAHFEVTERTIYRDMQALLTMGVPIASIPGVGYELLSTFRLPPVMLTSEEATALWLGGRMLSRASQGQLTVAVEAALQKISAVLPSSTAQHLQTLAALIDFFPPQQRLDWDEPHLLTILDAIQSKRAIRLTYRNYQETETTQRIVEPYQMTFSEGAWYVNGYCRLRQDLRSFRLNRIVAMQVTDEPFVPRQMVPAPRPRIVVRVRFQPVVLPHVLERQHYAYRYASEPAVLVYEVQDLSEIQSWLLGFGAQAEVLEPQALRDALRAEAERLIQLLT